MSNDFNSDFNNYVHYFLKSLRLAKTADEVDRLNKDLEDRKRTSNYKIDQKVTNVNQQ